MLFISNITNGQDTIKVMTYNVLDYPNSNGFVRNASFQTVMAYNSPDILVVQELNQINGMFDFLDDVLTPVNSNYSAGGFINGPSTDNAVFYDNTKFSFINNYAIATSLRDINEFKLVHQLTGDTLLIYVVHLKASSGTNNENQRAGQVAVLRNRTNNLTPGTNYMVMGDFNIYGSFESAYQDLFNTSGTGYFIDLFSMQGTWNNSSFANNHTQSTRTNTVGGAGAGGGLDDRFDMILFSQSIVDIGGINVINSSYDEVGNDGNHYNQSINQGSNLNVPNNVAQALYNASDHLPVIVELTFGTSLDISSIKTSYATCSGVYNGSINLSVIGGFPPYSYLWSNGSTMQNLTGLTVGQYELTVTDAALYTFNQTVYVGAYIDLHLISIKQNISCFGIADGTAKVIPSGGNAPYNFLWNTSPPQMNNQLNGLDKGAYTVNVSDNIGCEIQRTVNIIEPPLLQGFYIPSTPTPGQSNGSVDLLVTGGIAPYTYNWSSGETTEDIMGKQTGIYYVTIVDRNGCTILIMINL